MTQYFIRIDCWNVTMYASKTQSPTSMCCPTYNDILDHHGMPGHFQLIAVWSKSHIHVVSIYFDLECSSVIFGHIYSKNSIIHILFWMYVLNCIVFWMKSKQFYPDTINPKLDADTWIWSRLGTLSDHEDRPYKSKPYLETLRVYWYLIYS